MSFEIWDVTEGLPFPDGHLYVMFLFDVVYLSFSYLAADAHVLLSPTPDDIVFDTIAPS